MRVDGRAKQQTRPIIIEREYTKHAPGSVLVSFGDTKVICTASVDESVPRFLRDSGRGWVTAEYGLLPGSTHTRAPREAARGKQSGRTSEIQRLIGRSLRSIIDLSALGERSITIDADVIQADGGTRTAAITGGMIALQDAIYHLQRENKLAVNPLREYLAAISVGVVDGNVLCDLCYDEDSKADVDMNIVMTESGRFVEIQGTAESEPFTNEQMTEMLDSARSAISDMITTMKALYHS